MPKYGVSAAAYATTASVRTVLKLVTATKVPVEIVEAHGYGSGTVAPADIQHSFTMAAVSAAGAGTGAASPPTPQPFSQMSAASGSTILWAMTAEPTTYATVFPVLISFNQRGGMRYAVPQGEGVKNQFETTNMHQGWRVQSSAVGTVDAEIHWWEN
jgi:hypothetical protein